MVFSQDTMGVVDRRDLLEISGSVRRTQFWMVLWIRDLSSDHPKVGPPSHTIPILQGVLIEVAWEWYGNGGTTIGSQRMELRNSLVQNGKTERFVGLLSGTLKASRSRTNP